MSKRDEIRKYGNDVAYDVWRSGGNVDRIDDDRVRDHFYDGYDAGQAADLELRAMRPRRPEPEPEEQYPEERFEEEPIPESDGE